VTEAARRLVDIILAVLGAAAITVAGLVVLLLAVMGLGALFHTTTRRRMTERSGEASRLRGRMRRLARPSLLLVPATSPGFSKLGGDPDLPDDTAWPAIRGRPCAFLAQIELAAFQQNAPLDWLPAAGLLYAFVDLEVMGPGAKSRCGSMLGHLARPGCHRRAARDFLSGAWPSSATCRCPAWIGSVSTSAR
jgi:hypothetical protein